MFLGLSKTYSMLLGLRYSYKKPGYKKMLFTNKIIVVYKITLKLMLSYRSLSRRNKIVRTLGLGKEFEFIDVLRRRRNIAI